MIPDTVTHAGLFRIPNSTGGIQEGMQVEWIENATDFSARGKCLALEVVRGWILIEVIRFVTPQDVERVRDILL